MTENSYTLEDKIGRINEIEQKIDWPKLTVMGKRYEKPATTASIGVVHFVVVPRMITPDVLKAIDEVKASLVRYPAAEAVVEEKKGK